MDKSKMAQGGGHPNKNKIQNVQAPVPLPPVKKQVKKTAQEKRNRMSGKNTDKPYISSSLGDMVRHMTRMACTENTLHMTDPPPVQFYDFWKKFTISKSEEKLPTDFVDMRKVSTAKLKINTSSFDFFGKHTTNAEELILHKMPIKEEKKKEDKDHDLAPTLSALWKDVRTSMSTESFISSSTKVSEPHDNVTLEGGWTDSEDEEFIGSDSDTEGDKIRGSAGSEASNLYRPSVDSHARQISDKGSRGTGASTGSVMSKKAKEHKEVGVVAKSILQLELQDQRVAMEHALKHEKDRGDITDYFMDDLDDSFLIDALSYGALPDSAFNPDFDYFNEDPIFREREKEREKAEADALLILQGKDKNDKSKGKAKPKFDDNISEISFEDTDSEAELGDGNAEAGADVIIAQEQSLMQMDYATCIIRQRKQIEDNLRAAVRQRSPMGSYKIPKGELPLARTFAFKTPGPAAYNLNAVKPNPKGVFLAKRWTKGIYETLGPGPAGYSPECPKCTAQTLDLHVTPRFVKSESIGPGPSAYNISKYVGTGVDKPQAIIFSRRPEKKIGCGSSKFVNCYGISRFGRFNPPKALIVSRHYTKNKSEPGPGAYDPYAAKDTRIGTILKSRIPPLGLGESVGYLDLPSFIGQGPGCPLGIRKFPILNYDSPGPIYDVPPLKGKGLSMTFKPFTLRGRESEPSPTEYGTRPGVGSLKFEYKTAPRPIMIGTHNLDFGIAKTPGPNKYKIKKCDCKEGIQIKGKHPINIDILPGPADYKVRKSNWPLPPRAVFQHRYKDKPLKENGPGFVYDPVNPNFTNVKGGTLTPRWTLKECGERGPKFQNLFGLTHKGKSSKIPLSLKSRHSPFVFQHISNNAEILKECKAKIEQNGKSKC